MSPWENQKVKTVPLNISDTCLFTGPYKVNGVPLRRVAQSYVIATQTHVDISSIKVPERVNDDYFKREPKKKKRSEDMFEDTQEVC